MACFDAWDIGGCGCGPAACTNAASFSVGGSNTCCICASLPLTFTLDTAFAGQTSFTLVGSESWPSSYSSTIAYGPNDSAGIPVAFFSNCFTDGTHSYFWAYDGQPILFKFTGTSCAPALYVGYEAVPQTGFSGYQCSPSFTGTYTVTSGQTVLYAAGVRSVAVAGSYGYPLCCMWNTKIVGCNSGSGANLIASATVKWWTSSAMTTLISTGAGGQLGVGSAGTWYRQISAPRFTTVAANKTVTCGGNDTTTLAVAAGYYCLIGSGCAYPLPSTLHCTFYYAGAQTFTYAAGMWKASFTYLTVAYVISIDTSMNLTCTANAVDFSAGSAFAVSYCPVIGPFSAAIAVPGSGTGSAIGNGVLTE